MSDSITSASDDENQRTITRSEMNDLQQLVKQQQNSTKNATDNTISTSTNQLNTNSSITSQTQLKSTSMTSFSYSLFKQTSHLTSRENSESEDEDDISIDEFDATYNTEEMPILEAQDKNRQSEVFAGKRRQAARRFSTTTNTGGLKNIRETDGKKTGKDGHEYKMQKSRDFDKSEESLANSVIAHSQMEAVHREDYEKRHNLTANAGKTREKLN